MRTSCDIPNRLWERAKQECIDRRVSLNKLIEFGLRLALRDDDMIFNTKMRPTIRITYHEDGSRNIDTSPRGSMKKGPLIDTINRRIREGMEVPVEQQMSKGILAKLHNEIRFTQTMMSDELAKRTFSGIPDKPENV